MQMIQTNHHLARLLAAHVTYPDQIRLIPPVEEPEMETAAHDFLVLNTRPDLSPELPPATFRFATR